MGVAVCRMGGCVLCDEVEVEDVSVCKGRCENGCGCV